MPSFKKLTLLILLTLAFVVVVTPQVKTFADSADDELKKIEEKLAKKQKEYQSTSQKLEEILSQANSVSSKITQLATELNVTQSQIDEVQASINSMTQELNKINATLAERNKTLAEKIALRNLIVRNFSKRGTLNDLEMFLSALPSNDLNGFQFAAYSYMFEKTLTSETLTLIGAINKEIQAYEKDKKDAEDIKTNLEKSQANLLSVKNQLALQKNTQQSVLG
ncbi:MAG: hypothetical protein ACD_22C00077G0001, partial [uncultured bacterium]